MFNNDKITDAQLEGAFKRLGKYLGLKYKSFGFGHGVWEPDDDAYSFSLYKMLKDLAINYSRQQQDFEMLLQELGYEIVEAKDRRLVKVAGAPRKRTVRAKKK